MVFPFYGGCGRVWLLQSETIPLAQDVLGCTAFYDLITLRYAPQYPARAEPQPLLWHTPSSLPLWRSRPSRLLLNQPALVRPIFDEAEPMRFLNHTAILFIGTIRLKARIVFSWMS